MKYSLAFLAAIAAVNASPVAMPQAVTAIISPAKPAPSGCSTAMSGSFGIAVLNVTGGAMGASLLPDGQPQASGVTQLSDGQPQGPTGKPVGQISDGQIQNPTMTVAPVAQISDGQLQATKKITMAPVTQISDGQIQATYAPVAQISDGQVQATKTAPAASQIPDGQIQGPTAPAVSEKPDGQPNGPPAPAVSEKPDGQPNGPPAPAVSEKPDGQPNGPGVSQKPDGQPQATGSAGGSGSMMVGCKTDSSLSLTLEGGILKDSQGRIGYIASNYQFQFDGPPQAGAIYTAGWSVCGNGSLALGGSNIFYQCLSGNFYNLYNENWAPQCNAVTINVLDLVDC